MYLPGRDLIINTDGYPIACATACSFNLTQDFIETCAPDDGYALRYLPTTNGWTLQAEGIVDTEMNITESLLNAARNRKLLHLQWHDNNLTIAYNGDAYIESIKIQSQVKGTVKYSASFRGNGTLNTGTSSVQQWSILDALHNYASQGMLTLVCINENIGISSAHAVIENKSPIFSSQSTTFHSILFRITPNANRFLTSVSNYFTSNFTKLYPSRFIVLSELTDTEINIFLNGPYSMGGTNFISLKCLADPGYIGAAATPVEKNKNYHVILTADTTYQEHTGMLSLNG